MSKIGGRFCAVTGGVTLVGRVGTKSKEGFHGMSGYNDVSHRSVRSMVVGGNISWKRMSGSAIKRPNTLTVAWGLSPLDWGQ